MKNRVNLSDKARKMLQQARRDAHKRVVKRGLIQFRAEEELVDHLLQIADHKKMPAGVLVRSWVAEHVRKELPQTPVQEILLPDGNVLNCDSYQRELEKARLAYEKGKLPLSAREARTLEGWLQEREQLKRKAG